MYAFIASEKNEGSGKENILQPTIKLGYKGFMVGLAHFSWQKSSLVYLEIGV